MAKDFASLVRRHAHTILNGTVLAIDPASGGTSLPGWAAYSKGQLLKSGSLPIGGGGVQDRLRRLFDYIKPVEPDVLVIERIRGARAHEYLHWAVGVSVAAANPLVLLEMPITTWKFYAGKSHVKGDEADALAIGNALLTMARNAA